MAKDFNVYKWRRDHLNEGNQNPSLKAAMEEWFGSSTPTREEMINFVEWFYNQDTSEPSMMGLNEDIVKKKIKDLTVQDVLGVYLPPTINSTTSEFIDTRDMFDDNWRQARLDRWRKTLYQDSPGSEEWEVNIMKNEINRKVLDWGTEEDAQKYKSAEEKSTRAAQADYAANKSRYQGD